MVPVKESCIALNRIASGASLSRTLRESRCCCSARCTPQVGIGLAPYMACFHGAKQGRRISGYALESMMWGTCTVHGKIP